MSEKRGEQERKTLTCRPLYAVPDALVVRKHHLLAQHVADGQPAHALDAAMVHEPVPDGADALRPLRMHVVVEALVGMHVQHHRCAVEDAGVLLRHRRARRHRQQRRRSRCVDDALGRRRDGARARRRQFETSGPVARSRARRQAPVGLRVRRGEARVLLRLVELVELGLRCRRRRRVRRRVRGGMPGRIGVVHHRILVWVCSERVALRGILFAVASTRGTPP